MSPPQGKEPPQGEEPPQGKKNPRGKKNPQEKKNPQGDQNTQGDELLEYKFRCRLSSTSLTVAADFKSKKLGDLRAKSRLQNFCRVVTSGKGLAILCVIAALMVCYVLSNYDVGKALNFIASLAKIIAL